MSENCLLIITLLCIELLYKMNITFTAELFGKIALLLNYILTHTQKKIDTRETHILNFGDVFINWGGISDLA